VRTGFRSKRLRQAFGNLWRKYVVDECPDDRAERLREKRIGNIMHDVVLLEAMRRWELENEKSRVSKD